MIEPPRTQSPRRFRRASGIVCCVICVSFVVLIVRVLVVQAQQSEVSDADLERASAGRTVRIGLTVSGVRRATDIPFEVYVARVLAGEGEPRAAGAAQQALAVAIRTFTLANLNRHQRDGFDLCDTTHCQVVRAANPVSRSAAMATAGQVLLYDSHPADVFYSASCGGHSESASAVWPGIPDYPYLRSVGDDVHDGDVAWVLDLPAQGVQQALRAAGFSGSRLEGIDVARRNDSGRVATLRIEGLRPGEISGADFRTAIGTTELRSTAFSVQKTSRGYRFTGRGFGHGVGMCVIGAGRRAARGESAAEILGRYYPGLRLTAVDGASTGRAAPAGPPVATAGSPATPAVLPKAVAPHAAAPAVEAADAGSPASRGSPVRVRIGTDAGIDLAALDRMALVAHAAMASALGTSVASVTLEMHSSIEDFRRATGRPWWAGGVVNGTAIDLAPAAVFAQHDGVEAAVRIAMAGVFIGAAFDGRPAWMRVGAARYFGRGAAAPRPPVPVRLQCPVDAELSMSMSAPAQREAEMRAELCFVRAREKAGDWRKVR